MTVVRSLPTAAATELKVQQQQQQQQRTCVCVIGVGYVGEVLLKQFSTVFDAIGYDISADRIARLRVKFGNALAFVSNNGIDKPQQAHEVVNNAHALLSSAAGHDPSTGHPPAYACRKVLLTSNAADISAATHFFIAVPTTLRRDRSVNLQHVRAAVATVRHFAAPGSVVVIESSVPVGTTRELLGPLQNLYHCGMSPERIDPGRVSPAPAQIPKLVSGLGPAALKRIVDVYSAAFGDVRAVSGPEVAEMTKLFENCFRMVNIAYVNEMSDACRAHGVNPFEMIEAAATKPFGFMPFYPGLGVGGHCIPVNPFYLLANNRRLPVLEQATGLMLARPRRLARRFYRRCIRHMTEKKHRAAATTNNTTSSSWSLSSSSCPPLSLSSSSSCMVDADDQGVTSSPPATMPRIVVVGLGFKAGQADVSGSPALAFLQTLHSLGCGRLAFYDPLVEVDPLPIEDAQVVLGRDQQQQQQQHQYGTVEQGGKQPMTATILAGSPPIAGPQSVMGSEGSSAALSARPPSLRQTFPWLEKLPDRYWTAAYVDLKFDGLYVCSNQDLVDMGLAKSLRSTLVGSYVNC